MAASAPADPHADPAVGALLRQLGAAARDDLAIGGIPVGELAERFGTPLYAYDFDLLSRHAAQLRAALGPRIELLFSIKANPTVALVRALRAAGTGCEIASLGELEVALAAGHAAGEVRFAGPGKTDADIERALALGLGCFHVESASECAAIAAIARRLGRTARVAVRVNLARALAGARLVTGGAGARFGVDQDAVPDLLASILRDGALRLAGLHVYAGTQCFQAEAFVRAARELCELAATWERDLGCTIDELDLGGGFGVATYLGDPAFDLPVAVAGLRVLVAAHDRPGRRWFIELGRFLAAPCGVYVARVVHEKRSGERSHVVLDGGLHHCAIAAGSGSVLRRPPLLVHATQLRSAARATVAVGGPLCTPQDQFADAMALPPCRRGDLLAVLGVGAYGASFSPTGFLSHATPAEVAVADGTARCVRARGEPQDVLRGQSP